MQYRPKGSASTNPIPAEQRYAPTCFSRRDFVTSSDMEGNRGNISKGNILESDMSVLITVLFETFLGISLNAFIIAVNCIDWVSRICLLFAEHVELVTSTFNPSFYNSKSRYFMFAGLAWFLSTSNLFFAACLSVYYCVKIANFSCRLFITLKQKISQLMPWLLLVSVMISLLSSLPTFVAIYNVSDNSCNSSCSQNHTGDNVTQHRILLHMIIVFSFGFSIGFTILCISAVLLLFSLWRHIRHMQGSSAGVGKPSMEAHVKAVKMVLWFLFINLIHFLSWLSCITLIFTTNIFVQHFLIQVTIFCPSIHALILILSIPKLKQALARILRYVKCKGCAKEGIP
ncbi:taste receptor type 2 member 40-like [Alligator sinensis]|uniref:Taste receptor type 2 n=1 Tax=Alligator sinensis TaxID=38654 RepID=A0A1U7RYX8_ALLSI|nr:taste receptor type 2 member 40-like [Alligator sinensis]